MIALGDTGTSTLNFGFSELNANFSQSKTIKLRNKGSSPATFNISQTNAAGSSHSIVLGSSSVTIPAGADATVNVTLNVPVATVGASNGAGLSFREVAGLITFTPTGGSNNDVTLRVPYYLVPRALSGVNATMAKSVTTALAIDERKPVEPERTDRRRCGFLRVGSERLQRDGFKRGRRPWR